MKRSKYLVGACSAVLMTAWAGQGLAQNEYQGQKKQQNQQTQQNQQSQKQVQGEQQRTSAAHGTQAVIDSAGQPTNVLVVGKVTDARDVTLAGTAGDKHRLLKVQPKGGKEVVVDIGVRQGASTMEFTKGDRIVAMGKPARINGRPVLFAANVAEMQRVNISTKESKQSQSGSKGNDSASASQARGSADGSSQQANQQASQQGRAGDDAVIYLFDTNNYAKDDYGLYDEDFVWITPDSSYHTWNDTAVAWEDTERAHYDMFGYDDAGEAGLWDW